MEQKDKDTWSPENTDSLIPSAGLESSIEALISLKGAYFIQS